MKSLETEPAPPPIESHMASAGATIPCAPAGACATIQPESWEYAPVTSLPPPGQTPVEALPRRRLPIGKLLLAAGVVAFVAVGVRAVVVTSQPAPEGLSSAHSSVASPSHVFVDVDAIVVLSGAAVEAVSSEESPAVGDGPVQTRRPGVANAGAPSAPAITASILPAGDLDVSGLDEAPRRPTRGRAHDHRGAAPLSATGGPLVRAHRRHRAHAVATGELVEGRAARAPAIRTELDARAVAAVVTRQHHRLERCYERALTRAGVARSQALRLVVRISPEGGVSTAQVEGANLPSLAGCLEGVARAWAFPASRSGAEVPIPLRFTPQA